MSLDGGRAWFKLGDVFLLWPFISAAPGLDLPLLFPFQEH